MGVVSSVSRFMDWFELINAFIRLNMKVSGKKFSISHLILMEIIGQE